MEWVHRSERTYILLSQATRELYNAGVVIRDIREKIAVEADHIRTLLMLKKGEALTDLKSVSEESGVPVHNIIRTCREDIPIPDGPDREREMEKRYQAQFRRLAREIGGCRIGLALSSGCAKAFAHIGVIQVLEEYGIEVDVVVGSSMGAYIGACWASGYNGRQLEELARELESPWMLVQLLDPVYPPRKGLIKGKKIERRLRRTLGEISFTDLSISLHVVGTRLSTLERTTFSEGDVVTTVHASCAMPGICVPVDRGGEAYIDGGITDPLPVSVLAEMGIERIIAVSTVMSPELARECALLNDFEGANDGDRLGLAGSLNRHLNYFARGNVLDIVMHSIEGSQIRIVERDLERADVTLQPITCSSQWHEFNKPGKYISMGRQTAMEQLDAIRSIVTTKAA